MTIEELLRKGFILNHSPRKPVQKPGSRGGKGYYTDKGKWEYGTKPYPRLPKTDLAYGVTKLRTPAPAPDLARAINEHLGPYLEKLIEHEEFFSTGVIKLGGEYEGNERQSNKVIDEAIEQAEEGIQPYIKPGFIPRVLGSGIEAMAIDLGDKVARIQAGGVNPGRFTTSVVPNRPNFPWMLQAIDKGETKLLGWEVLPKVILVNRELYDLGENAKLGEYSNVSDPTASIAYYNEIRKDIGSLYKQAEKDNYDFGDNHPGNIGYINGKPIIIDPGAVTHFNEDGVLNSQPRPSMAEGVDSRPPLKSKVELEDLEKTVEAHYIAINKRGYKVMDKTVTLDLEKRVETWRAVDAVTANVEQAFPDLKDIMTKQPLVINVTSASLGDGVRGEHHSPLYKGAPNTIDINSEYSRTFMHELGHYLDSAAAILHPSGQWNYKHKLSDMYNTPIFNVVAKLKGFPEYRQWIQERPKNERNYWTRNSEIFGRFFDQYMYHKLGKPPSDSYEPYTDQELEETGKMLEEGLKQLRLMKAFNFISSWSKAFGDNDEPDQASIGVEGGKYYVDKYGKKHYGPYGTQPAKHLKVTATEQPYIHEQALSVTPSAPVHKPPAPQKTIATVVDDWKKDGPGSYKDLVQHFMKTGSKTMMSQALDQGEGTEAIKKYSESIAKAVESQLSSIAPKAQEYEDLILYLMPMKDRAKLAEIDKFNRYTDPAILYDRSLVYFNNSSFADIPNKSLDKMDDNELGIIAIAMINEAERNLGKKIGNDTRMVLQEKYIKYLQKRKQDTIDSIGSTPNIFKHSVKIEDFPAAPPPLNDPSPDVEAKIRKEFPSYSRQDWKRKVQKDIGERMIKLGVTEGQANEFLSITGKRPRNSNLDVRLTVADILVETWAQSADGEVALSVAVQRLTSEVFPGARKWDTINSWNDKNGWERATVFLQNPVFVQVASAFLYAQYENTQDYFKRLGVSEVTIGRGLKTKDQMILDSSDKAEKESKDKEWGDKWVASGEWDESSWFTNPLSSWGFDPETNSRFSGSPDIDTMGGLPSSDQPGQPVVVAVRVPVQRIIGGFFSGNGAENEHEVVLIGMQKNLDKALWATWGTNKDSWDTWETNASATEIIRMRTSVAQSLMEGRKPTGHTLHWTTPEEQFTAEFKPLLQAKGAEQGWSKFTDKQLLQEIQMLLDPFTQTGINIGTNSIFGSTIDNDKVLNIAHKLMDKGFGIPYEEFIDKKLKTMLPLLQDATPEQKENMIPKNLIANFVNDGIIDKKHQDEAVEYLKYKLKTAKPSEQYKEAPDKMKDITEEYLDHMGITNKNFMFHGNTPLGAVKSISKLIGDTLGTTDDEKKDSSEQVYSYLIVKWGGLLDATH